MHGSKKNEKYMSSLWIDFNELRYKINMLSVQAISLGFTENPDLTHDVSVHDEICDLGDLIEDVSKGTTSYFLRQHSFPLGDGTNTIVAPQWVGFPLIDENSTFQQIKDAIVFIKEMMVALGDGKRTVKEFIIYLLFCYKKNGSDQRIIKIFVDAIIVIYRYNIGKAYDPTLVPNIMDPSKHGLIAPKIKEVAIGLMMQHELTYNIKIEYLYLLLNHVYVKSMTLQQNTDNTKTAIKRVAYCKKETNEFVPNPAEFRSQVMKEFNIVGDVALIISGKSANFELSLIADIYFGNNSRFPKSITCIVLEYFEETDIFWEHMLYATAHLGYIANLEDVMKWYPECKKTIPVPYFAKNRIAIHEAKFSVEKEILTLKTERNNMETEVGQSERKITQNEQKINRIIYGNERKTPSARMLHLICMTCGDHYGFPAIYNEDPTWVPLPKETGASKTQCPGCIHLEIVDPCVECIAGHRMNRRCAIHCEQLSRDPYTSSIAKHRVFLDKNKLWHLYTCHLCGFEYGVNQGIPRCVNPMCAFCRDGSPIAHEQCKKYISQQKEYKKQQRKLKKIPPAAKILERENMKFQEKINDLNNKLEPTRKRIKYLYKTIRISVEYKVQTTHKCGLCQKKKVSLDKPMCDNCTSESDVKMITRVHARIFPIITDPPMILYKDRNRSYAWSEEILDHGSPKEFAYKNVELIPRDDIPDLLRIYRDWEKKKETKNGKTRYFASRDRKPCCRVPCHHNWYIAIINIYTVLKDNGDQTKILTVSFPRYVTRYEEIRNANPQELYNIMMNYYDPLHRKLMDDYNLRVFLLEDYPKLYGELGFVWE